jgi:hypothetical protein
MTFDEMLDVMRKSQETIEHANNCIRENAKLARSRLRLAQVDAYTLDAFKRELRQWNTRTHRWKC